MRNPIRKSALMAAAMAALGGTLARASTWSGNDSPGNPLWSDAGNWDVLPSTGGTAVFPAVTGTTSEVDSSLSLQQLTFNSSDITKTYNTSIDRGVTLTLNGLTGSNTATTANSALVLMPNTAATSTQTGVDVVITSSTSGSGTLGAINITSGNFLVSGKPGAAAATAESFAILDLSGLDSFTYTQATNSSFMIGAGNAAGNGDNGAYSGKIIFGNTTNIKVNRFIVGGQNNAGTQGTQPVSLALFGQTTNLNTTLPGNESIGGDPTPAKDSSGGVMFRAGLTNAVANIGDTVNNRNALNIGIHGFQTGHLVFGTMDGTSASGGSDGELDGGFTNIKVGAANNGASAAGGGFGMLSIDKGTLDANKVTLGFTQGTGDVTAIAGYMNVGVKGSAGDAGSGLVKLTPATVGTLTTFTIGQRAQATATSVSYGVVNLANSGGVTADRMFVGDNTGGAGTGSVVGILNIGSGTTGANLTTGQIQAGSDTAQTGTNSTRLVNFNGGTVTVKSSDNAATFMQGLTGAYVYGSGGRIDTNGIDTTINQALLAPTGSGVASVGITSGGSGYRVAPLIIVTRGTGDTTGIGATAVAQINSSGAVTGITVTNPGTGYTATPVFQLIANGGTTFANILTPYGGTAAVLSPTLGSSTGGALTKAGNGALFLSASNTYSGGTTVAAGSLFVTNTSGSGTGSGNVQVIGGATFGGTGTASGAVSFGAGSAVLSPGTTTAGVLTTGTVTLASDSNTNMSIGGTARGNTSSNYSAEISTGDLNDAGTLNVALINSFSPTVGMSFDLFDWSGSESGTFSNVPFAGAAPTGGFAALPSGEQWDTTHLYDTGVITVATAVPEPATLAMAGLMVGGALLSRRRK